MKSRSAIIVLLIFCLFMGITAVSVGLGAAFPGLNQVAAPVVCPSGTMEYDRQLYKPYPGKTVVSGTWYCTTAGSREKVSMFLIGLIAGTLYGLGMFLVLFVLILLKGKRGSNISA